MLATCARTSRERYAVLKFVHSATIMVKDQDAAVDFYVNKLGFEKRDDSPFGENSRWIVVAPKESQAGIALLRPQDMGRGEDGVGGHTGISMVADDVKGTYETLAGRGVQFTSPPQQMPWGATATWFSDQDGNSFFLTEG